jgi:thioredoxin 1
MEAANKQETFGQLIQGDTPVLVDFFAEWCQPCKLMKPILQDLHAKMPNDLRIIKIDIDKSPAAAGVYQVQSVPTLVLFRRGKILWRQSGVVPAAQLEQTVRSFL